MTWTCRLLPTMSIIYVYNVRFENKAEIWGLKLSFQVRQLPQLLYSLQNALWSYNMRQLYQRSYCVLWYNIHPLCSTRLWPSVSVLTPPSLRVSFYFILEMNSYIFFSLMWSQCSFVCTSQVIAVCPHLLLKYLLSVPLFLTWSGEVCRLELGHPPSWWWNSTHWFAGKSGCTVVPNSVRAFHCWSAVGWT